jgi:hypothetical protein
VLSVTGSTISAWADPSAGTQHCEVPIVTISSGAPHGLQASAAGGQWTMVGAGWQAVGRGR